MGILGVAGFMQAVAYPLGLHGYAALILLIQWAAFLPAYHYQTEVFYDLVGSLTYITAAVTSRNLSPAREPRQLVGTLLVLTWAFRLGFYLFTRCVRVICATGIG